MLRMVLRDSVYCHICYLCEAKHVCLVDFMTYDSYCHVVSSKMNVAARLYDSSAYIAQENLAVAENPNGRAFVSFIYKLIVKVDSSSQ